MGISFWKTQESFGTGLMVSRESQTLSAQILSLTVLLDELEQRNLGLAMISGKDLVHMFLLKEHQETEHRDSQGPIMSEN